MYNLKRQVIRLGLKKNVIRLGEQSNVIGLLKGGADLFVSAAREEVFSLVFTEAAIGIVAPDVGGISDVVIDGKTGKAGHQYILSHFSIQKNCHKFELLYNKILTVPEQNAPWYKNWPRYFSLVNGCKRFIIRKTIS
ncbi:MAG: glycosyltransferase involved in cell wall biosynthesis [Moritella sp.]|jgi:glycosyltransferase involved in cell wall biosynthesis